MDTLERRPVAPPSCCEVRKICRCRGARPQRFNALVAFGCHHVPAEIGQTDGTAIPPIWGFALPARHSAALIGKPAGAFQ